MDGGGGSVGGALSGAVGNSSSGSDSGSVSSLDIGGLLFDVTVSLQNFIGLTTG